MNSIIGIVLISIGVLFNLFGCIGLIRLPDVYNRLQSATKCVTLGTCSILLGLLVIYGFNNLGVKVLIAIPLLFFSATVSAHALARGAHQFGVKLDDKTIIDQYNKLDENIRKGGKADAVSKD